VLTGGVPAKGVEGGNLDSHGKPSILASILILKVRSSSKESNCCDVSTILGGQSGAELRWGDGCPFFSIVSKLARDVHIYTDSLRPRSQGNGMVVIEKREAAATRIQTWGGSDDYWCERSFHFKEGISKHLPYLPVNSSLWKSPIWPGGTGTQRRGQVVGC
jgi:hypothetical protein